MSSSEMPPTDRSSSSDSHQGRSSSSEMPPTDRSSSSERPPIDRSSSFEWPPIDGSSSFEWPPPDRRHFSIRPRGRIPLDRPPTDESPMLSRPIDMNLLDRPPSERTLFPTPPYSVYTPREPCLCPSEADERFVCSRVVSFKPNVQKNYDLKLDPDLKRRCPGDVTIREGEKALTVASVEEKYPIKTPMDISEDSVESLGSLEETPADLIP